MSVLLAETFDQDAAGSTTPAGWSIQTDPVPTPGTANYWTVQAAPAGLSGHVAAAAQNSAASQYLTRGLSSAAGAGTVVRLRFKTGANTTSRWIHAEMCSGTVFAFSIFASSDGKLYLAGTSAGDRLLQTYTANTVYDVSVTIGASGALTQVVVNGTPTSFTGVNMAGGVTTVNTVRIDPYSPSAVGTQYLDIVFVDTSTAVPNGTLASTGSLDGVALGGSGATATIGFANGTSIAAALGKIERSPDNATWTDVSASVTVNATASGFTIVDSSSPDATNYYRVTASNATGDQAPLATGPVTTTPPITHIGTTSGTGSGTSAVLSVPTGVRQGDLLIAAIFTITNSTVTPPAGWTQQITALNGGSAGRLTILTHVAGASEPGSYTFNLSGTSGFQQALTALRNIDQTTPVDVTTSAAASSAFSLTMPSVTATNANAWLYTFWGSQNTATTTPAWSSIQNGNVRVSDLGGFSNPWYWMDVATEALSAAGATGTRLGNTAWGVAGALGMVALTVNPAPVNTNVTIAAPAAQATASATAPVPAVQLNAPNGGTTAGTPPPDVAMVVPAPNAAATASGTAPAPVVAMAAPNAQATGSSTSAALAVIVGVPNAQATASATAPTIGNVLTVSPPSAQATATGVAPGLTVSLTVPAGNAMASAPAPDVAVVLGASSSSATASSTAPDVAVVLTPPNAQATASGIAPVLNVDLTLFPPAAVANATGVAPKVSTGKGPGHILYGTPGHITDGSPGHVVYGPPGHIVPTT